MTLKNLPKTLIRSSLIAFIIFWLIIFENVGLYYIIIFSFIPVFIICSLAICLSIVPFFLLENQSLSNDDIFKKYFPYYSIVVFAIVVYSIIGSDFDDFLMAFMLSAFFSLMYAWVCLCKISITNTK